ncbi:substrate-binding domain-containing protein [Tepidibacter formicigenes]|jgi:ribose transport system substrate-binding protein|uniref:Monosaccharide ABC transporter substrate-binding protein, CUT2 family n=1 Tax=Tepidibacter formicigenes DSM 15518 TaxID=1123349 RepID=A0A1M6NFA2_9FIRM|nr:substrate-binding domain-containing protein [Tepidibacter formicigenes]SHJ94431.1 monosaccharide ABC transporter substrate-binding protein, CUT2 family [Tepidibacter formicigenes DSM 15518]
MKKYIVILTIFMIVITIFLNPRSMLKKNQNQYYIKTGKYHFALILKQEDSYWTRVEEGARDAAKELGVTITVLKNEYFDKSTHLDFIDRELESNVDGIISYSLNEESYKNLIDKCIKKGVQFVTVEEDTPKSKRNAYIGTNSYYIGNLLANRLLESIDYRGNIGVIMENKEDGLKLIGIHDEIIKNKNVSIVDTSYIDSKGINTYEVIKNMIIKNRDLKGLICTDGYATSTAGKVLVRLNKVGKIKIVGMDDLEETLRFIKIGVIEGSLVRNPYDIGYKAVKAMYKIKKNEFVEDTIFTNLKYVNKETLNEE